MGFTLTKLMAAFGNMRAMEKLHVDDHTEAIIKDVENTPFAISEHNVLYAGLNELGGYYFFQTVVVGAFHIKTLKGAQLTLKGNDFEMILDSDMPELESDHSNVSNRSITKIDFQIEEADIDNLKRERITEIRLVAKKQDVTFTKYVASDEEE